MSIPTTLPSLSSMPIGPPSPYQPEGIPGDALRPGHYSARWEQDEAAHDAVLQLRFHIFHLELGEGLAESFATGRDRDPFDAWCHHLMVTDVEGGQLVGTYRAHTKPIADSGLGWDSATLFDVATLPGDVLERAAETGRACIAAHHRNGRVLYLLWKGLATYLDYNGCDFMFGCTSLTTQDPEEGLAALDWLEAEGFMHPTWRCSPQPAHQCVVDPDHSISTLPEVNIPQLMRIYLHHGCKILGPPAIDREFKTIDFLTILNVREMDERVRRKLFGT